MARARLRSPECTEPWTHYCGLRLARGDLRLARGEVRRQSGAKGAFCNFIIFVCAPQQNPDRLYSENSGSGSKSPRVACFLVQEMCKLFSKSDSRAFERFGLRMAIFPRTPSVCFLCSIFCFRGRQIAHNAVFRNLSRASRSCPQGRMWQGNYEAITSGVKDLRGEQPGRKFDHRFRDFESCFSRH
jgi:hypothetical protein